MTEIPARKLSEKLEELGCFRSLHVREAFEAVPRAAFAPEELNDKIYRNFPLQLPFGVMTHPYIFVFMLDEAYLCRGNKVLLIDEGSGWEASLIAELVHAGTEVPLSKRQLVFALESSEEAKHYASSRARAFGSGDRIVFFTEKSLIASQGPFERIMSIERADAKTLAAWKEMLSIGGRIVTPVGESILVLQKNGPDDFEEKRFFGFHFSDSSPLAV